MAKAATATARLWSLSYRRWMLQCRARYCAGSFSHVSERFLAEVGGSPGTESSLGLSEIRPWTSPLGLQTENSVRGRVPATGTCGGDSRGAYNYAIHANPPCSLRRSSCCVGCDRVQSYICHQTLLLDTVSSPILTTLDSGKARPNAKESSVRSLCCSKSQVRQTIALPAVQRALHILRNLSQAVEVGPEGTLGQEEI
jgi:hypothetical protein